MYVQSANYAAKAKDRVEKRKYNVRLKPEGGLTGIGRGNYHHLRTDEVRALMLMPAEERNKLVRLPMVRIQKLQIDREGRILR